MLVFAVDGDEDLRPHSGKHFAQFVALGVAGGVDGVHAFIEHFRAHAVHFVDKFGDGLGVAGYHARAHDHGIAFADIELAVNTLKELL